MGGTLQFRILPSSYFRWYHTYSEHSEFSHPCCFCIILNHSTVITVHGISLPVYPSFFTSGYWNFSFRSHKTLYLYTYVRNKFGVACVVFTFRDVGLCAQLLIILIIERSSQVDCDTAAADEFLDWRVEPG